MDVVGAVKFMLSVQLIAMFPFLNNPVPGREKE